MINRQQEISFQSLLESEPSIQQVRSIQIQSSKYKTQRKVSQFESESLDSVKSVFNSDYDQKPIFESSSRMSTANTIHKKNRRVYGFQNSQNVNQKLAQRKRIQSFRLDEDVQSYEEEESLPEKLMDVDLYFRQDAIVSVQKILETKRKLS
ncbi:unnamed protein product (macronuclear) [Paramecium tetraurelia]|uniref:Uncharacterized protein n=1 Tax=Paramecium tetraurelia TaxID=5888 RepID=A0C645_PARTE|nr:uncharacterized protein GSPATT00035391001 [Paramecium tetraurelia]CAK66262.1 unnamed protein product [Paramecium tetraurelia]|eukprot:XP_001433659.1 hypothetical protein (macronuclear) [Paramecium tetraurelia strain d4-2]